MKHCARDFGEWPEAMHVNLEYYVRALNNFV